MVQKTIQDYYAQILELYPSIPESDIKKILQYGWKLLYLHNSYGGDVVLQQNNFWFYTGRLMTNSLNYFHYYRKKLRTKMRVLYRRNKVLWDGYYYFGLTSDLYEQYKSSMNKRGRPKKHFKFNNVALYKLQDECNLMESSCVAFFRVPFVDELGFIRFYKEFKTSKLEFLEEREPLKMSEILVSHFDYLFLKDKKKYNK